MTVDEILDAMPDEDTATGRDYLVIDPVARTITVPLSEKTFGVTGDDIADRKYFICPRYVGDNLDLAGMFIRVNYRNAGGDEDGYLVDDVTVSGNYVTFSWRLWPKVTEYKGAIQFGVCADLPNTTERRFPDWNTTMASGEVLEGMHPYDGDVEEETRDVVTQLREMVTVQTGNVEAVGASQVQAVQTAATAATADAQAQIEAKGAATLATIPADYTTMANKTNEQANAIKGHLSGEIVQAGDVSPVEHYLGVKVHGKNLFNTGKFEPAEDQTADIYVSAVEAGAITLYCSAEHNGYYSTGLRLREVCRGLEPGKTYTLSAVTEATGRGYLYLHGANVTWWYGKPQTMTEEMLDSIIVLYSINGQNYGANSCTISNIQIEEGTVATEYTPYIDPAGVTITRCGKNLLPYPFHNTTTTINGAIYTDNGDGSITVSGTPTDYGSITLYKGEPLAKSGRVVLSGIGTAKNVLFTLNISYGDDNTESIEYSSTQVIDLDAYPNATQWNIGMKRWANNTEMSGIAFPQIEAGEVATEYEPYKGKVTAKPDESGTVTGLPSAAPTMTLLADTAGVTIDCTYNRDSNAVYAELLAKIAALGGTI